MREKIILNKSRQLSWFNKIMLWIHYFIIVCLLFSVSAKYISPLLLWLPAFFGLAFPVLFILNFIMIIFWFIQFKSVITFGIIALFISLPTSLKYFQISFDSKFTSKPLKITSYNTMLFDLYNWKKNKQSRSLILSDLSELESDILCFQEFYTSEAKGDFNNIDTLKSLLKTPFYHTEFTITLRKHDHWGLATFSKYPIINKGKLLFNTNSNNLCIFSDIIVNKDTIRVYNIHLQSISFSKKDNKFLNDVVSEKDAQDELENSKNILRRLKLGFIKRTTQVDMIVAHIKTCRYKIMLCGDFNDTGASYTYHQLTKELNDAFIKKGTGFGRTYAGKWPQFRIDYILYDEKIKCIKYSRSDETHTDHYPITAFFER